MKCFKLKALCFCVLITSAIYSQTGKKKLAAKRIHSTIKIDGVLNEAAWKDAPVADKFISLRPAPFVPDFASLLEILLTAQCQLLNSPRERPERAD